MRWFWLVFALVSGACSDSIRQEMDGSAGVSAGSSAGSGATGGTAGSSGSGGSGGVGGAGGNGGTSGQGGSAGSGGMGAVGGSGGSGGNSGTGGVGGTSAGGTSGGGTPQCESDRDCVLQSDCCSCGVGLANGRPAPACTLACIVDMCTSMGVERATCAAGRCVLDVSCNENEALCDALPPQCDVGQAPIVGSCYGLCIDAQLCRAVTTCDVCTRDQVCVSHQSRGGSTFHCVPRPADCVNGATCECMGGSACTGIFNSCNDSNGAIACTCPSC